MLQPLDKKFLDHPLKGKYSGCRECHLESDWLLIYFIEKQFITFIKLGHTLIYLANISLDQPNRNTFAKYLILIINTHFF